VESFLPDLALAPMNLETNVLMATFIKARKRKKTQSSFTTLHGILLSLAIAGFVGLIFVLVVLYWHPPQ
jgi:hypothetical protein